MKLMSTKIVHRLFFYKGNPLTSTHSVIPGTRDRGKKILKNILILQKYIVLLYYIIITL
jgi:hypothetical protein